MPRTAITVTQGTKGGTVMVAAVAADVPNGNSAAFDERTVLIIKNTNGTSTSRNITFTPIRSVDGQTAAPRVEAIPAGETHVFSSYDLADYGSPIALDGSHAEVTIQAVRS